MDALDYLSQSPGSFWSWTDGGEAVAWSHGARHGATIAFRRELAVILGPLAAEGLPPFDLVLLVLAACREGRPEDGGTADSQAVTSAPAVQGQGWGKETAQELVGSFARVRSLPADLRGSPDGKRELIATVFEDFHHRATAETSRSVLDLLRSNVVPEELWTRRRLRPLRLAVKREMLRALDRGTQRLDAESLELRIRTGLERGLAEPPCEETSDEPQPGPVPATVRELLVELEQSREFAGLARLTRNLMAVVHLPQSLDERDELPMGGVSDVTNRGPFDRLLLSELAHDADTLMSRVALGEALYLRRERPPSLPPRRRVVLLDSGLRMWGVPRVFAAAVALSVAARADRGGEAAVFRASGKDLQPVDHRSRAGLEAHLAALEPHAHPGAALPALADAVGTEPTDVVLVTGPDVLADAEFRSALDAADLRECVVACVDRDGSLRLMLRSARGEKLLREARLDLESILEPPPTSAPPPPLVDKDRDPNRPAILSVRPFPLRLPHPVAPEATWPVGSDGVLSITPDRRLMHWDEPGLGAVQLSDRIPSQHLLWWKPSTNGRRVDAVIGQLGRSSLHLLTFDLDAGRVRGRPLDVDGRRTRAVTEYGGMLLVVCADAVCVFSLPYSERLSTANLPRHLVWRQGRFFVGHDGWHALALRGESVETERVLAASHVSPYEVEVVFDSEPAGGPVAVFKDGRVMVRDGTDDCARPMDAAGPVFVTDVAPDGSKFVARWKSAASGADEFHLYSLPGLDGRRVWSPRVPAAFPTEDVRRLVRQTSLRSSLRQIGMVLGSLILVTRKGRPRRLYCDRRAGRWQLIDLPTDAMTLYFPQPLLPVKPPEGVGYRMRMAQWADGSRAFVDSRGLLHLQSSDPAIPEATLVLDDEHVSGWSADGRMWGAKFYIGRHAPTPAEEIDATIIEPFIRRLR